MENEEVARNIPGEKELNTWHHTLSLKHREPDQPVIHIQIQKWRIHSLIEEVSLAKAA